METRTPSDFSSIEGLDHGLRVLHGAALGDLELEAGGSGRAPVEGLHHVAHEVHVVELAGRDVHGDADAMGDGRSQDFASAQAA